MSDRNYVDMYHHSVSDTTGDTIACPYCEEDCRIDEYPREDQILEYQCAKCERHFGLTVVIRHRYIAMPEVAT